jgi:hypothetical protein
MKVITITIDADGHIEIEISGTGAANSEGWLLRILADAFKIKSGHPD